MCSKWGRVAAILWLHGFTGSHETFLPYAAQLLGFTHVLVDLPGHGRSIQGLTPVRLRAQELARDLDLLMRQLGHEPFSVIGYSMGGRIAIALTALVPERITRLVLESASPGLDSMRARVQRRAVDEARADKIAHDGLAAFLAEWEQLPLFASQAGGDEELLRQQRDIRQRQSAVGLCMSLLGHGTGVQPSYWPYLMRFALPVYLLTGELDEKFTNTAKRMLRYLPDGKHVVVPDAGHTIHIEQRSTFLSLLGSIFEMRGRKGLR